jgi:hypothetical protein
VAAVNLSELREAAVDSKDGESVARWLLLELVANGGLADRAAEARRQLAALGGSGMVASLARGIDADGRGKLLDAGRAYIAVLAAARDATAAEAPLLAWYAARRLGELRLALAPLEKPLRKALDSHIAHPGAIGWRARAELVALWAAEQLRQPQPLARAALMREVVARSGCLTQIALAGPFDLGRAAFRRPSEAEAPGPWPARFEGHTSGERPERRTTSRVGCTVRARDAAPAGGYVAQTFFDLEVATEVVLVVHAARAVFVDDTEVLTRDPIDWGVWPRFGVRLALSAGRHRIVARLAKPETAIRVLSPDGLPLGLRGTTADAALYVTSAPRILSDPNALASFMSAAGVTDPAGWPALRAPPRAADPGWRYLAAYLAYADGQHALASVILEPLVADLEQATPLALAQQALFVTGDPVFPESASRDLARDLRKRSHKKNPGLWSPALWLTLDDRAGRRRADVARDLEALSKQFPEVPAVHRQLIKLYRQLGWTAEHLLALEQASARFPLDVDLLTALLAERERRGEHDEAERLAHRIRALDPREELSFRRALERKDYPAAIRELKRIGGQREDRRDISARIEDVLARAGQSTGGLAKLEHALSLEPNSGTARLAVADARFAAGDRQALSDALVDAIRTGAPSRRLRTAIELVEGMTDLEPFRRDGLSIIERSKGVRMPGTAARILDYAALWIEADGRSRMLEHEIIRIQSREAIGEHAEQRLARGAILKMRTIKADGRVFEPEIVSGKPTVTMPHLEVGDYIETESIWVLSGPGGEGGKRYRGPRWYFREKNISYHTSEFVVISPQQRTLEIETTGSVPPPVVVREAGMVTRRWRVTRSTALPEEPLSAPQREFLPSVQVGWGVTLDDQLARWMKQQPIPPLRDPRMRRIALTIAGEGGAQARARRIYRWVLDHVQLGKERRGPRIVTGRSGDRVRAFVYLCRLLDIDARVGVVKNRLQAPARGPFSRAMRYSAPAVRVQTASGTTWMLVGDRYAPFGYLPSALRGQEAVVLESKSRRPSLLAPPLERETTQASGVGDGIAHRGSVRLSLDGSAHFELTQSYSGRFAILLRNVLGKVPPRRHKEIVETKLLASSLPGVRVKSLEVLRLDELDEPVILKLELEVPNFARGHGKSIAPAAVAGAMDVPSELVISAPFLAKLSDLARLPHRQSPLYISNRMASRTRVELDITLPAGAKLVSTLRSAEIGAARVRVKIDDGFRDGKLLIRRDLEVTAGRVQPGRYEAFRARLLEADAALRQTLRIRL